ncbi:MAG: biopolymer transporter ExbD [Treponema sp.]|jgi:biopolymer transport protein ExbD|nr:biopolymer transporter ExbD [Treponema sp.]
MKRFTGPAPARRDINITSLIDVIFMLVVFFMIGSRFEKPVLGITLPTASSGEYTGERPVIVSLDAEGRIYVEGEAVAAGDLEGVLVRLRGGNGEFRAALECDGAVPFQKVTGVIDILKSAGVYHVAIRHNLPR